MASALDIVNRSLLSIGAKAQVSSIAPSDGSREADVAAVLFTPTFEALGRAAHWNCLRAQAALSLLAAAPGTPENPTGTGAVPPMPWSYSYAYPPDCLAMRFIVPSWPGGGLPGQTTYNNSAPLWLPDAYQIPYVVAYATDANGNPEQVILANQSQAQAVYTVNQPNPVIWDSQFQAAMVASLAAYFVPALSLNMALMQMSVKAAEAAIQMARRTDGNEGVTVMDHVPDWMRARGGAAGYAGRACGSAGGWSDMSWPAG